MVVKQGIIILNRRFILLRGHAVFPTVQFAGVRAGKRNQQRLFRYVGVVVIFIVRIEAVSVIVQGRVLDHRQIREVKRKHVFVRRGRAVNRSRRLVEIEVIVEARARIHDGTSIRAKGISEAIPRAAIGQISPAAQRLRHRRGGIGLFRRRACQQPCQQRQAQQHRAQSHPRDAIPSRRLLALHFKRSHFSRLLARFIAPSQVRRVDHTSNAIRSVIV